MLGALPSRNQVKEAMVARVATKHSTPEDICYSKHRFHENLLSKTFSVVRPINLITRLRMNPRPEQDGTGWKTPKILLDLQIEELGVNMSKFQVCYSVFALLPAPHFQYQDLLYFLEAQERFNLAMRYRKYRPDLGEYSGRRVREKTANVIDIRSLARVVALCLYLST